MKGGKRFTAALIALSLLLFTAGCSKGNDDTPAEVTATGNSSDITANSSVIAGSSDHTKGSENSSTTGNSVVTTSPSQTSSDNSKTSRTTTDVPSKTTSKTTTRSVTTSKPVTTTSKPVVTPVFNKDVSKQLSSAEQAAFAEVIAGIKEHKTKLTLKAKINADSLYRVYEAVLRSNDANLLYAPRQYTYNYSVITGNVINVNFSYEYTAAQAASMNAALEIRASEILAGISSNMSTVDVLKHFHDSIIKDCKYSANSANCDTAYGALIDGSALCEGYSRAFLYLCGKKGISCILVTGWAKEDHMWNMVEVNGTWYHMDLTWDDPNLKNSEESFVSYSYFNVTDSMIYADHKADTDVFALPKASSLTANYYVYYKLYAKSSASALSIISSAMEAAAKEGSDNVSIKLSSNSVYTETKDKLFGNSWMGVYNIINDVNDSLTYPISTGSIQAYNDDVMCVIRISFALE